MVKIWKYENAPSNIKKMSTREIDDGYVVHVPFDYEKDNLVIEILEKTIPSKKYDLEKFSSVSGFILICKKV